ncbi:MAG: hypothetical protein FWC47_09220 [Oscillospiraceae bacterium]|nr:hypothetical protein [Oscillospiraceae bacterium]
MLFNDKAYYKLNAMELFFFYLDSSDKNLINLINGCLKKEGIAVNDCVAYAFANEYEDYDYDGGYFGSEGVKFVIQEPIATHEKCEVYTLEEFYNYLVEYTNEYLKHKKCSNSDEILKKLVEIKEKFSI